MQHSPKRASLGRRRFFVDGKNRKKTPLYGNPRFIHHPRLFQCLGDGSRFIGCGVPRVPIKNYPTFSLSSKNPWVSYHQVTPIRDPFITADLLGRPPFLKGSPATSPFKRSQKCRIFCRGTALQMDSVFWIPVSLPIPSRRDEEVYVPTHWSHKNQAFMYRKINNRPTDGMGYVIGFQMAMLDCRCWIVPFGSGKTLGFKFWCCLLI